MKNDLLIVPTYIAVTLCLTFFLALFFVLYPFSYVGSIDYSLYALYALDVFLYASLYILPSTAIASLVVIILRAIKYEVRSMLSFLTYVFLCLSVWLLLIPLFIFFVPEQTVSLYITGVIPSSASFFFNAQFFAELVENLNTYSISVPNSLLAVFSDLILLREKAFQAGNSGRFVYLLYASLGLALSSLYSLRFVSTWKLINVANVLFLGVIIVGVNIQIYRNDFGIIFNAYWTSFIFNCSIAGIVILIGIITTAKQKLHKKEDV